MCLECGDGTMVVELYVDEDREFQTIGAAILKALD